MSVYDRIVPVEMTGRTAPPRAGGGRPLLIRFAKPLRGLFDRLIAASSLVPNDPVLDVRKFGWTQLLRENWHAIRDEAIGAAMDRQATAPVDPLRRYCLWGYGYRVEENIERCPATAATVAQIPNLHSAYFSIIAPGTHVPAHRGVTKGLVTCHLGLIVPRDGDVRMRVDDRVVRWAEGETLVFDDTYDHEVWNDTASTRVVLLIQVRRPLRNPGKWIADAFLDAVRRSAFVQDARGNVTAWNAAVRQLDV